MKKLPLIVFMFIMISSLCSSICSYHYTKRKITNDVSKALALTLKEMPDDVISTDTIQCYRNHITIAELRDTASISIRTVRRKNRIETELVAESNCNFFTVFGMSEQKSSGGLLFIGILWLIGSLWYTRKYNPISVTGELAYGGLIYSNEEFTTTSGHKIRLTPMQYSLLHMFFTSTTHTLSKQEICDCLWPKKPDASDTLYTLIRRIKPIIEANSNLKIESNIGKSYSLEIK